MQVYNYTLTHYGVKGMKWGMHRIKKGKTVQRITDNKNEDLNGRTYISFKTLDNLKYVETAGEGLHMLYSADAPNGYKVKLKVTNDIIYPSYKKSMDSFIQTVSNNPIDKITEGMSKQNFDKFMDGIGEKSVDKALDDSYRVFSRSLMYSEYNRQRFFSELKANGYNAVIDYNDVGFADTPLIVFEKSHNLKQISATPITYKEKDLAFMKIKQQEMK